MFSHLLFFISCSTFLSIPHSGLRLTLPSTNCLSHLLFSSLPLRLSLTTTHHNSSLPSLHFLHRPIITTTTTTTTVSAIPPTAAWLAKLTTQDFAHFELPSSHLFTDDPSTIQVACSVLLTGAITVFFFRSVQRRAKRAKELVYSLSFFLRGV